MKACSIYKVPIDLAMMILNMTILKMNFNFKFKDMLAAARASMWELTNGCDSHHTEKYRIKRAGAVGWRSRAVSQRPTIAMKRGAPETKATQAKEQSRSSASC
jgi:hypothetical protein